MLNLRRETKHPHDLGDPGAGHALPAGDLGLVLKFAGIELSSPLDGLVEELDHKGVLGFLEGLGSLQCGGTALTTHSGFTRRVGAPAFPFSNAPLGPRAISTFCSR
jgi:hypothetical protein